MCCIDYHADTVEVPYLKGVAVYADCTIVSLVFQD